jgi:hypothetical protein
MTSEVVETVDKKLWCQDAVTKPARVTPHRRRIVRIKSNGSRRESETGEVELSHVGTLRGRTTVVTYIDRDD